MLFLYVSFRASCSMCIVGYTRLLGKYIMCTTRGCWASCKCRLSDHAIGKNIRTSVSQYISTSEANVLSLKCALAYANPRCPHLFNVSLTVPMSTNCPYESAPPPCRLHSRLSGTAVRTSSACCWKTIRCWRVCLCMHV